ncbi:SsgA family sporulation/cell division regulator [Kitasatospora acidiphila]|uniref:SsgA family sporulation/cell division regulator n=1 Tax=Kitasatospora acidiphila TaxID=2567942 RepID=A0A540W5K8_9ACTN|nr:SsgA family sporulation/cell division regulator [Kitasatospora acidiphila]TQF04227.1 SsgA family sporulation/cell division regulator [Kitasatospora acidiphila]
MQSTVQGQVVMSLVVSDELSFRLVADLEYAAADPYAVRLTFHLPGDAPVSWVFGRELLVDGLSGPSGEGDVRVRPLEGPGRVPEIAVLLRAPGGDALLRCAVPPLVAFLERAGRLVPVGEEPTTASLDAALAAILSRGFENQG